MILLSTLQIVLISVGVTALAAFILFVIVIRGLASIPGKIANDERRDK